MTSSRTKSTPPQAILCGIACAALAGVFLVWLLIREPGHARNAAPSYVDAEKNAAPSYVDAEMAARLELSVEALSNTVADLVARMDAGLGQLEGIAINAGDRVSVIPTTATSAEKTGANDRAAMAEESSAQWITVLDKDVACALVEHGLTPFDSGVAPLIRVAGNALRSATREMQSALDSLSARTEHHPAVGSPFMELSAPIRHHYSEQRRIIIERLQAELDALCD